MQADTQELALFRTVDAALSFAFNFKHGQYKPSGMAVLMGGSRPAGRGLGGLDGAGQAGMICCEVDQLEPRIRSAIIIARFTPRLLACACKAPCCSGYRPNSEWMLAVADATAIVRSDALGACHVNYALRRALVTRYFGLKQNLVEAAKACGVDRDTASAHASRISEYLKREEKSARNAIEGKLKEMGIVE